MKDVCPVDRFRHPADEVLINPYEFYRERRGDDPGIAGIIAQGFTDFNSLTGADPPEPAARAMVNKRVDAFRADGAVGNWLKTGTP